MTPADNPQSAHIIPSDEYSICSEPPLAITTAIKPVPLTPTEDPNTEPSYETLHKNSI